MRKKNLDVITEQSFEAETVKENTLVNNSAQFSIDLGTQSPKEDVKI